MRVEEEKGGKHSTEARDGSKDRGNLPPAKTHYLPVVRFQLVVEVLCELCVPLLDGNDGDVVSTLCGLERVVGQQYGCGCCVRGVWMRQVGGRGLCLGSMPEWKRAVGG